MKGKEKCKALKEIRKQIAEANDIEYAVSECKHQRNCLGTCPKCESELRYLERELAVRQRLGKAVAIVGLSTGVCATLTACHPSDIMKNPFVHEEVAGLMEAPQELDGDIAVPSTPETSSNIEYEVVGENPESETEVVQKIEEDPEETQTQWEIAGDIPLAPSEEPTEEP